MDKQGIGKDMWTSSQNAQLAHIPKPLTHAYPQGFAFGLTRFACQQPFEMKTMDTEYKDRKPGQRRPVAYENGSSLN
jgi:hypothetical protein